MNFLMPSVIALVAANLIPLFGVAVLGWEVFPILVLFWSENVVIGAVNVLRMLCAEPRDLLKWAGKLFVIPFFCFHYGMFTFVHGMFVLTMFGGPARLGGGLPGPAAFWRVIVEHQLGYAVAGIAVSHLFSFGWNYLRGGEYRQAKLDVLMRQPYSRVVVLHLTIIFGGMLVFQFQSPAAGVALLVVLKTVVDVAAHLRERRKLSGEA
jgi:hypothetical protein